MQKIEFLKCLIADAEQELEYIEAYQEEVEAAQTDNAIYSELWKKRNPSRQRVRDDMKMIRRISFEVERRLQG